MTRLVLALKACQQSRLLRLAFRTPNTRLSKLDGTFSFNSTRLQTPHHRKWKLRQLHISAGASGNRASYQLLPARPVTPVSRQWTTVGVLAALSIVALFATLAFRSTARQQQAGIAEGQDAFLDASRLESKEFAHVLATVRQVVQAKKAVHCMREGDTARAMVELYRAQEENAICRSPLNTDTFSQTDLEDVYRMHLHNSELPLHYPTLLQLRALLGISTSRAEEIESELSDVVEFSI